MQRMLGLNEPPAVSMPVPRRARPRAELKRVLRQRTASVPGTYVLLAANVAMFAAVAIAAESIRSFSPRDLIWWGANFGPRTTNGEWWRLLTATVLHAHLPHLIFNMIALLMVGPIVERLVGCRAFVAFYVACGLTGSAASLWAHPLLVGVGASGAILGLYGMLVGFMFEHRPSASRNGFVVGAAPQIHRAQLQIFLHDTMGVIVSTVVLSWWVPNVDNAAHLGGLAAGCAIGWIAGKDIEWTTPRPRQIATAMVLGAICCGAALGASGRLPDLRPAMISVFEIDSRTRVTYSRAIASKGDDASLSILIESDILSALAAERKALAAYSRVAALQQPILDDLRQYVALHEEAWRHRARGHRERRADLLRRSTEIEEAADLVMRRLLRARVH
jgi:membrane associated rhomboid family serine protease